MLFEKLQVTTAHHQYPIYIGKNLLTDHTLFAKHLRTKKVMLVSNTTLEALYVTPLKSTLSQYDVTTALLPDGEQYKTLSTWETLLNQLATHQHHRDSTLIALGGGVIGDITGFAAACYQRGINLIQVPTTLLAQVDSSIGGKTGVNHPSGKNLIGAFYQPNAVLIDIDTLKTLPPREYNSGLAEIVKAALLADAHFFEWLEHHAEALMQRDAHTLTHAIYQACTIKATIVMQDERENHMRALLNLGHTFAHGIERTLGYGTWLHGEAVAVGLVLAAKLSQQKKSLTAGDVKRIETLLRLFELPIMLPKTLDPIQLDQAMRMDKKIENNQLRFVLLNGLGCAHVCETITEHQLKILYSSLIG